jgi:Na+/melibiose symporter-like transporter
VKGQIAAIAAGFTGLLSLFNIGGRFFWASLSDKLGRKVTYAVFFVLGFVMYVSLPWSGSAGSIALFVAAAGIILSLYGGGFATIPAYLADPDMQPADPAGRQQVVDDGCRACRGKTPGA